MADMLIKNRVTQVLSVQSGGNVKSCVCLSHEPFTLTPSLKSFLCRRKRHLVTLPDQNQETEEQRVYVDSFCCIIRKAGATLRAATASGFLSPVFSHKREVDIKVEETSMISMSEITLCVCVCDWPTPRQKVFQLDWTNAAAFKANFLRFPKIACTHKVFGDLLTS